MQYRSETFWIAAVRGLEPQAHSFAATGGELLQDCRHSKDRVR
jgi:hypothetical protein